MSRNYAPALLAVGTLLTLACAGGVTHPAPKSTELFTVPQGDPPVALYVPLCPDTGNVGPCVGQVGNSAMWIYTPAGAGWPQGIRIKLCMGASGGPDACAYVPSVQSDDTGDSGAYVYLSDGTGGAK